LGSVEASLLDGSGGGIGVGVFDGTFWGGCACGAAVVAEGGSVFGGGTSDLLQPAAKPSTHVQVAAKEKRRFIALLQVDR